MKINKINTFKGTLFIPGDKSISHRSIIFGALSKGTTEISNFLMGADCLSTIDCFRKMGVDVNVTAEKVVVEGKGLWGLEAPKSVLDVGNSGTTLRLLTGLLSAQPFITTITGDASIQKRPMLRVVSPLREMGANIEGKENGNFCPLTINGQSLKGINYNSPIASAQVKSALLLAGLYAEGNTTVTEPHTSRNHSELMLNFFGANVNVKGNAVAISKQSKDHDFSAQTITVPGDISSAAFPMTGALLLEGSDVLLKNVGINPTRDGILEVYEKMGANIEKLNIRESAGEKVADLRVTFSHLKGVTVDGGIIPRLIDEIPVIAVAACFAEGTTIIKDAAELKVKESNRIEAMVTELKKMGANIEETEDGMIIHGQKKLLGGTEHHCYHDHRIAMSLAIAGYASEKGCTLDQPDCVKISYPDFFESMNSMVK